MSDWNWKLRLFLSADVIGSTAFKASKINQHAPDWAPVFREFFQEFPESILSKYHHTPDKFVQCNERIQTWKFAGDEILFYVELKDFREVATHLWVFKEAVLSFPETWLKKQLPLRLKAAAWLAGFPVTNMELCLNSAPLDFIGPSIDLGFRIAKFADHRRFVLSADLCMMLLDALYACEIKEDDFALYLHGREILKGVIRNEAYPIICMEMKDGDRELEEELLGTKRVNSPNKLVQFLRKFIDRTPPLKRPFIAGDGDRRYGEIPNELDVYRKNMEANENKEQTPLQDNVLDKNYDLLVPATIPPPPKIEPEA